MPTEPPSTPTVAVDATPVLGYTGVGNFCRGILGALDGLGSVRLLAFAVVLRHRRALASGLPPGVPLRGGPMPSRPLRIAWAHVSRPSIERFVGPVDVVHGTNFIVPPASRAARVLTVHDLTPLRFPEMAAPGTSSFPRAIRAALDQGAWLHTHTRSVADEVVSCFDAPPERVVVVPSGIPDVLRRSPAEDGSGGFEGGLPQEVGRYILAVGTIEPRKDPVTLVRAFDRIAGGRPDLGLVFAGPEGWGSAALAEAIDASAHARRIVRLGYLADDELADRLRGAAVLAYPSIYEGFGYPPLQAMAAGVPVVATRTGSLAETLGDAAALVQVGDADALAGALAEVLDDPVRAEALRIAGRSRAATYTWDRCATGLVGLYRSAAGQ